MEYAIIGVTTFIMGVVVGLFCKIKSGYDHGYDHGFSDASMVVEYLRKKMEGK